MVLLHILQQKATTILSYVMRKEEKMNNKNNLPYSDERLASIMNIHPCEFKFLSIRKEIKQIVQEYNYSFNSKLAIQSLERLKDRYMNEAVISDAIDSLIFCIKLW